MIDPSVLSGPALAVLFLTALAAWVVHSLLCSPLKNVPGPLLGKFGVLWYLWHMLKTDHAWALIRAHRKYGSLVRIGGNEVSVCSASAVRQILLKPYDKGAWYKIFAYPDSTWTNQMCETSAARFAVTQKKIASGYSLSNIIKSEPEFDAAIVRLEARIDEALAKKEPIPLYRWFTFFAFDLVGQTTFSKPFGFLEKGVDIGGCVATSHYLIVYLSFLAHFHKWHDLLTTNRLVKWLNIRPMPHVMATTENAVRHRESNEKAGNDMMERWKQQKSGSALTYEDLLSTANSNVAAGGDTVGGEYQGFVYLMLRHPRCLTLLREEIDQAALTGRLASPVQYADAQNLSYFQACLKEVFRYHPAAVTSYPRVVPHGGLKLEGKFFPEGTIVSVNAWAIHRDPSIWGPDVDEFKPERWLQPSRPGMESNLIHFGAGYMQCPGKNLALIQMNKLLPSLFLDYDIEFASPREKWKFARGFLARAYGWHVTMRRR